MKTLTMLEFSTDADHDKAQKLARVLGFGDSWSYTTSSDIPGLYCVPTRATQPDQVIVKTAEFGMVAIRTFED